MNYKFRNSVLKPKEVVLIFSIHLEKINILFSQEAIIDMTKCQPSS